jgi:hypothetical protein
MMSGPEFDKFMGKWRNALREYQSDRSFWEGKKAYLELKRTEYLERVRLEEPGDPGGAFGSGPNHFIPQHALPQICAVLDLYRQNIKQVRELIELQKGRAEWLSQKASAFMKKATHVVNNDPELARAITHLAQKIDEISQGTRYALKERLRPDLKIGHPFEGYKKIWQERQLDTWFQVQLGAILRDFMRKDPIPNDKTARGPSSRTIARLIVLFLVCADLADSKQDVVRLKHNGHRITVEGVLQHLRRARL